MSRFIQPLEPRRLLSVSATTLSDDYTAIHTDAGTLKTDLNAFTKNILQDGKVIGNDVKGTPKSNLTLYRKLTSDQSKTESKVKSDVNLLLKADALSKRSSKSGTQFLSKQTTALGNTVRNDITALSSATTTALSNLTTDSEGTSIRTDLTNISSQNATSTSLISDTNVESSDLDKNGGALRVDASAFADAVAKLKLDLQQLLL